MSESGEWHVLQLSFPGFVEDKYVMSAKDQMKLQKLENAADKAQSILSEKSALYGDDFIPDVTPRQDLSLITHSVFYKVISAHQIEVRNLPLSENDDELRELLKKAFSIFGIVSDVELPNREQNIANPIISYDDEESVQRAQEADGFYAHQPACDENSFGPQRYLRKFQEARPSVEELERITGKEIEAFETAEAESRARAGTSKIARHTEAEFKALIKKAMEKEKAMQSTDFYGFQQNTLLSVFNDKEEVAPRHMKKKPKKKMQKPGKKPQ